MADEADGGTDASPERKLLAIAGVLLVVILVLTLVSVSIFRSTLERGQEGAAISTLKGDVVDGIRAEGTISNVDPAKAEMSIRIAMDPVGNLDDSGLLARPVTLYYVSVEGTKQIDFKAGKPLGATDLTVPLLGDTVSSYPWDSYEGDIELLFVTASASSGGSGNGDTAQPAPQKPPTTTEPSTAPSTAPASPGTPEPGPGDPAPPDPGAGDGAAGRPTAQEASIAVAAALPDTAGSPAAPEPVLDTLVPVELVVFRNVPAYNVVDVSGSANQEGVITAHFGVKRAPTAIFFSLLVTAVMWALAIGVLFVALSVILRRRKLELAIISMMAIVLFAMPAALRSFQPGIPPPGVLSDFYGFFWCDVIVAASLLSMLVLYLKRGIE